MSLRQTSDWLIAFPPEEKVDNATKQNDDIDDIIDGYLQVKDLIDFKSTVEFLNYHVQDTSDGVTAHAIDDPIDGNSGNNNDGSSTNITHVIPLLQIQQLLLHQTS